MTPQQKAKLDALAEPVELSALREENRKLRDALAEILRASIPSGEARKHTDTERLDYWFGLEAKIIDADEYLRGVREGWSLERWRQFIDACIDAAKEKA